MDVLGTELECNIIIKVVACLLCCVGVGWVVLVAARTVMRRKTIGIAMVSPVAASVVFLAATIFCKTLEK